MSMINGFLSVCLSVCLFYIRTAPHVHPNIMFVVIVLFCDSVQSWVAGSDPTRTSILFAFSL